MIFTRLDKGGSPPAVDIKGIARMRVLVHDTLSEIDLLVFKCLLHCSGKIDFVFLIAFCMSRERVKEIDHIFCSANTFFWYKIVARVFSTRIDKEGSPPAVDIKGIARMRVLVQDTLSELDLLVFKCSLHCSGQNDFVFLIAFCMSREKELKT